VVTKRERGESSWAAGTGVSTDGEGARGELSDNAYRVLHNRYLRKDDQGQVVETPVELFRRVAKHVASSEKDADAWAGRFFDMMWSRRFMPNSPTLMNAGRPLGMLSACFVLPLEDSIADIMETARQIALVQRAGGGTGVDLSKLRPRGSIVRSSGGTTEGPLSFLKMLSSVTDAIQQGAFRRGANMGTMRVDHPDVLSFITIKEDLSQVTNYNLSCTVPDAFMEQLKEDRDALHVVVNPNDGAKAHLRRSDDQPDYAAHGDATVAKDEHWTVGDVFDLIIKKAWESGEPGLIFIDHVNEVNPTPHVGEMTSTNPCGEQPLLPYEACNLGSLNLAAFHRPPADGEDGPGDVDWDGLAETVRTAVRFLDDVVEVNNYPTDEIDRMCRANRKIGLGVMGWADLLFKLGIRYDSDGALALAERVAAFIRNEAWDEDGKVRLPLYGRIAAGTPIESLRDHTTQIDVPPHLVQNGDHYALEVVGDSMVDAGIHDGDIVVIQRCDLADNGDIVVALIDDNEVTLKRLRRKGGTVALEAANVEYETRIFGPNRVKVQGRLTGLMRSY